MTTKTSTNGLARKTLADQIDRLDAVLDDLADGINDTVVAAVQEAVGAAVQQAVQAVVREMLASPALLARLAAIVSPATTPSPQTAEKAKVTWKQRWCDVRMALTARLNVARLWCVRRLEGAGRWTAGACQQVRVLACYRKQLLVAAGVGMMAGVAAYLAGPCLAAAAGATGGFATTLAVHMVMALRRLMTQTTAPAL